MIPSGNAPETSREQLERTIGYIFTDKGLLYEALCHKSYHHEHRDKARTYNERLEFLGDSVIGLIVVEYLFSREEVFSESVLAKMKSYLVCEKVFAELASSLSLSSYLLLGKGEESTGGRGKKSILSDAFESLVGAIYLDSGYETARDIVMKLFKGRIDQVIDSGDFFDYKTDLQELTQAEYSTLPEYRIIDRKGEEHNRVFTVSVYLNGSMLATASGKRIKEAEGLAAKEAIEKLRESRSGAENA